LWHENEAFALALGSSENLAPNVGAASTSALLAQIGAGLSRLRLASARRPLSEFGQQALSELTQRGSESDLTAALSLLLSASDKDKQTFGQSLLKLSSEPNRAGGALIAAALLQKVGEQELAE